MTNRQSIAPNGGFGYQPRHVDFHPTQPFMYLNLERQNQLQVYRVVNGESVEPKALFTRDTLDNQAASKPAQMTGAIHVHPNGRFVYLSNRASGTTVGDGKPVWEGGENTIGVYAIDQKTGEPVRIQNIDSGGMHARTFTLDAGSGLLVAANQNAVTKADGTRVPASLAVFRIGERREAVVPAEVRRGDRAGQRADVGGVCSRVESRSRKSKVAEVQSRDRGVMMRASLLAGSLCCRLRCRQWHKIVCRRFPPRSRRPSNGRPPRRFAPIASRMSSGRSCRCIAAPK